MSDDDLKKMLKVFRAEQQMKLAERRRQLAERRRQKTGTGEGPPTGERP